MIHFSPEAARLLSRFNMRGISSLQALWLLLVAQVLLIFLTWGIHLWWLRPAPLVVLTPLQSQLEQWQKITITQAGKSALTFLKTSTGQWVMPEHDNLLVDVYRLSQTLRGLGNAKRLTLYGDSARLQEETESTPSLHAAQWLLQGDDKKMAPLSIYWGKRLSAQALAVRAEGSSKVFQWLHQSAADADRWESLARNTRGWLDVNQFGVPGGRDRLVRIEINHPRSDTLILQRAVDEKLPPIREGKLIAHPLARAWTLTSKGEPSLSLSINSESINQLTEALGELLIVDVIPASTATILRQSPALATITFRYLTKPPLATSSMSSLPNDALPPIATAERRYQLYTYGNAIALDFGGKAMVEAARVDGETLQNARREWIISKPAPMHSGAMATPTQPSP
jgi:hypothetical protein